MKKFRIFITSAACALIMVSCSSTKELRTSENLLNGTWQLSTITTEGITGKIKTQILSEADFNCFVGSTWNFNKKNNLGYYAISKNGDECAAVKRNIRWSVNEGVGVPAIIQYKRTDADFKDIAGDPGIGFTILAIDKNSMQLKNDLSHEGKPATFIYKFVKN